MKIRNILLAVSLIIVIAIAGILYFVFNSLDSLVETAIEDFGSEVTQTKVQVGKVKISLQDGEATIKGLRVANPKGFSKPEVFTLGEIIVRIDAKTITDQPIVIDEIRIMDPSIFYEINQQGKANLQELKNNVAAKTSAAKKAPAAEPDKQPAKTENRLAIRRLIIENGRVEALIAPLENKEKSAVLPRFELHNIGGKQGASSAEIALQVTDSIVQHAFSVVATMGVEKYLSDQLKQKLPAGVLDQVNQKLGESGGQVGNSLKQLLGQ